MAAGHGAGLPATCPECVSRLVLLTHRGRQIPGRQPPNWLPSHPPGPFQYREISCHGSLGRSQVASPSNKGSWVYAAIAPVRQPDSAGSHLSAISPPRSNVFSVTEPTGNVSRLPPGTGSVNFEVREVLRFSGRSHNRIRLSSLPRPTANPGFALPHGPPRVFVRSHTVSVVPVGNARLAISSFNFNFGQPEKRRSPAPR